MTDAEVLVVGGGPVGLATALHARAAGLDVAVVEPRPDPVDKACGEGLMPPAVAALSRLGVGTAGMSFAGIRYVDGSGRSARASFPHGPGLGVRRTALQAALASVADAVGVVRMEGRVEHLRQDDAQVVVTLTDGSPRSTRWLVGADGLHSLVRREVGLAGPPARVPRFGQRRHFRVTPWTEDVEVHWARHAEAYVTPVAADTVGVAVLAGPGTSYEELLGGFPLLGERLGDGEPVSPVRGAGPLRQRVRGRVAGRVLLVGDAAGYVDALTGDGLGVGFAAAEVLVRALAAGRPESYEAAWRRVSRRYRLLTAGLVSATRAPLARREIVAAAAHLPGAFPAVVGLLASPPPVPGRVRPSPGRAAPASSSVPSTRPPARP